MKKYLFLDLDGTLVTKDTLFLFVRFLARQKSRLFRYILYVLLPGFVFTLLPKFRGKYKSYLARYFQGISTEEAIYAAKQFYKEYIQRYLNRSVLSLVEKLKAEGYQVVLTTASLDFYAKIVAEDHQYSFCISSELEVKNGCYTGRLKTANCKGREKLSRIKWLLGEKTYTAIVVTDHHDDLPLIEWCDKAYVTNPTNKLRKYLLESPEKVFEIPASNSSAEKTVGE